MQAGSHIRVWRGCYYHHGIYVGTGLVVHHRSDGIVMTDLEEFCQGASLEIVPHPYQDYDLTMARAYERLGEQRYHLLYNNCESFANWCATGERRSRQVENGADFLLHTLLAEFW